MSHPADTGLQRDVAVSNCDIGRVLAKLGKLPEALEAINVSLGI